MYANLYPFKLGLWCVYFLGIVTGTRESESSSRLSQQVVALQFQSWMACHLGVPQIPFHWMKWRTRISISRCLDIQNYFASSDPHHDISKQLVDTTFV
jgi:hypothetical protein